MTLLRFNLNDKDPDALVEVDLQRLQFVKAHLTLPSKNDLYLKALEELEKQTISYPVSTRVTHRIALHWVEMGGAYNPLQGDAHKWDLKKPMKSPRVLRHAFVIPTEQLNVKTCRSHSFKNLWGLL